METLVVQDSPLAAYLEGEGEADTEQDSTPLQPKHSASFSNESNSFAPRGLPTYLKTFATRPQTLKRIPSGPISKLRNVYALAVTSTLGKADNERFLEHFRYIVIASQLLDDHVGTTSSKPTSQDQIHPSLANSYSLGTSLTGAGLSALAPFLLVSVLDWARDASGHFIVKRIIIAIACSVLVGILLYAFVRRHWLKYLRHRAVETANAFVTSVQAFENVTCAVLTFVQEVELISRGYRISNPLPPISRLEGKGQSRKCARLRSHLDTLYMAATPAFTAAVENLRPHVDGTDLDRFLEVYSIREDDMPEAFLGITERDGEDPGSLNQLRIHQHRLSLLRRIFLCSLLSIPATGRKADALRWRTVITQMETLLSLLNDLTDSTSKLLDQEEHMPGLPTSSHSGLSTNRANGVEHPSTSSPSSPRPKHHIRRMSTLTTGIRSLQAKLYLLNEDSTRSVSASPNESDLAHLSNSLREQYDSIGADLRALMQAWESGKQGLLEDISKQERRMSLASSSGRASAPSLGGLTAVEEELYSATDESGTKRASTPTSNRISDVISHRSAALRLLNGAPSSDLQPPPSPPTTESGESEMERGSNASGRYDEVFEAVAAPAPFRAPSGLTREQRIQKMHEDRERQKLLKLTSEVNTNMIRELQSVIRLRPAPSSNKRNAASMTQVNMEAVDASLAPQNPNDKTPQTPSEAPTAPTRATTSKNVTLE